MALGQGRFRSSEAGTDFIACDGLEAGWERGGDRRGGDCEEERGKRKSESRELHVDGMESGCRCVDTVDELLEESGLRRQREPE